MRQYMVEILRISSFLMVFFYRRFLPLDVFIYAFGAENDASSSNLPIPLFKPKGLSQILHLRQPLLFFALNYISARRSFTRSGSGGFVPDVRQAALPKATAIRRQSSAVLPSANPHKNPAMELSPAPIVDTASILGAFIAYTTPPVQRIAPFAPREIITFSIP